MSAKHRLIARSKRATPGRATAALFGGLLFVTILAGLLTNVIGAQRTTDGTASAADEKSVSQEGTLVALSANSLTARSADGYTQTYLVTADTIAITGNGSRPLATAPLFAINDEVDIVGTIQNGAAHVTAVAHRDMGHGHAPPMDQLDGQDVA